MLTIFTSPRPFLGEFDCIQRNAIQSWISVCPGCEIILIGDDQGTDKIAFEFRLKHILKVKKNEKGVILRSSVFSEVQKSAQNELMCFISADIILTRDFIKAVQSVKLFSFLLSCRRWDLDIKEKIDFSKTDWEEKLRLRIAKEKNLHGFSAGDLFVFPRRVQINLPPFSIKHGGWDNWFIYQFKALGIPVIDATEVITVIHQNHERPYLKKGKSVWKSEEGKKELRLAGGFSNMCTLRDADWVLTNDGLRRPRYPRRIFAKLSLFYPWRLILAFKRWIFS